MSSYRSSSPTCSPSGRSAPSAASSRQDRQRSRSAERSGGSARNSARDRERSRDRSPQPDPLPNIPPAPAAATDLHAIYQNMTGSGDVDVAAKLRARGYDAWVVDVAKYWTGQVATMPIAAIVAATQKAVKGIRDAAAEYRFGRPHANTQRQLRIGLVALRSCFGACARFRLGSAADLPSAATGGSECVIVDAPRARNEQMGLSDPIMDEVATFLCDGTATIEARRGNGLDRLLAWVDGQLCRDIQSNLTEAEAEYVVMVLKVTELAHEDGMRFVPANVPHLQMFSMLLSLRAKQPLLNAIALAAGNPREQVRLCAEDRGIRVVDPFFACLSRSGVLALSSGQLAKFVKILVFVAQWRRGHPGPEGPPPVAVFWDGGSVFPTPWTKKQLGKACFDVHVHGLAGDNHQKWTEPTSASSPTPATTAITAADAQTRAAAVFPIPCGKYYIAPAGPETAHYNAHMHFRSNADLIKDRVMFLVSGEWPLSVMKQIQVMSKGTMGLAAMVAGAAAAGQQSGGSSGVGVAAGLKTIEEADVFLAWWAACIGEPEEDRVISYQWNGTKIGPMARGTW